MDMFYEDESLDEYEIVPYAQYIHDVYFKEF